jgi:nucleotide-binding universal stress UspA family protein
MKTILVLTDFSPRAERAAALALELATGNPSDILIYHSVILLEPFNPHAEIKAKQAEQTRKENAGASELNKLAARLRSRLKPGQTVSISTELGQGHVTETIQRLVNRHTIWLIVMGSHIAGEGSSQLSDSNISSVLRASGCPVLLVP